MSEVKKVNPLLVLHNIEGDDFILSIAYVPSLSPVPRGKSMAGIYHQDYVLIDKEKDVSQIQERLAEMGRKHVWDVYMIETIANEIEEKYHPIALYLLATFTKSDEIYPCKIWPESTISIIRGEMIKDWDLRLEALKLMEN